MLFSSSCMHFIATLRLWKVTLSHVPPLLLYNKAPSLYQPGLQTQQRRAHTQPRMWRRPLTPIHTPTASAGWALQHRPCVPGAPELREQGQSQGYTAGLLQTVSAPRPGQGEGCVTQPWAAPSSSQALLLLQFSAGEEFSTAQRGASTPISLMAAKPSESRRQMADTRCRVLTVQRKCIWSRDKRT